VPHGKFVRKLAGYGCKTQMHVVRLFAPRIENEGRTKDIDFGAAGIGARREAGHAATLRALQGAPWRGEFDPIEGVILHEEMTELQVSASDS
jgi:NTE family protein